MTKRELELERIKAEADKFFEYPTEDKSHVSTTSMILFVEFMLVKATPNESDWMDIETAPRDGNEILIKREEEGKCIAYRVVYWQSDALGDYHWHVDDSDAGFNHHDTFPTHWMHLPD